MSRPKKHVTGSRKNGAQLKTKSKDVDAVVPGTVCRKGWVAEKDYVQTREKPKRKRAERRVAFLFDLIFADESSSDEEEPRVKGTSWKAVRKWQRTMPEHLHQVQMQACLPRLKPRQMHIGALAAGAARKLVRECRRGACATKKNRWVAFFFSASSCGSNSAPHASTAGGSPGASLGMKPIPLGNLGTQTQQVR